LRDSRRALLASHPQITAMRIASPWRNPAKVTRNRQISAASMSPWTNRGPRAVQGYRRGPLPDPSVTATDTDASNRVIHVIDAVLLPNGG
jgi:hypothetical protein